MADETTGTVLVFGGSGRTGQLLCREVLHRGLHLLVPTHAEVDLEYPDRASDYVLQSGAQVVINCAAVSGLEACADNPLRAHLTNAAAPAAMALACRHTGARFIHLSTDYVLDGRRAGKKDEAAHCRPACWYAESKREGELEVTEAYAESIIARVSWVCGNPDKPSFVETALKKALAGEPLAAVSDKFSLPTDAADIARAALALAATDYRGVIHLTSSGAPISWHGCALSALQTAVKAGYLTALPHVAEQQLDQVPFFREKRPRHTAMDNAKLLSLGIPMPTASETVAHAALRYLTAIGTPLC